MHAIAVPPASAGREIKTLREIKVREFFSGRRNSGKEDAQRLLGWLHLQCIIEAIEIVKQANRGQQFNHLSFIKMLAEFIPKLIVHSVGIARHALRQPQRSFFFGGKVRALFKVGKIVDLIVCPAMPSCQDGV